MTLQDILLEQKLETMNRTDAVRLRYQAEAAHMEHARGGGIVSGLRAMLASGLVRAGIWIDRKAGEGFAATTTH